MTNLANIYAELRGETVQEGEALGLEEALAQLCTRGRAAHPALGVVNEVFVRHLARCRVDPRGTADPLYAEDLYLACACLEGNEAAIAELRAEYAPVVARYLRRIAGAEAILDEVAQRLWEGALVGESEQPKLTTYTGRGALGSWIGISAQRIALMQLRHERSESRVRHEAAAQHEIADVDDPEIVAIKKQFRGQLQAAVESAIAGLDDRDKAIYHMHLVDGLPLERIGRAYGVHHTTVLRWLTSMRARILEETKRQLRAEVKVSSGEFDSIARLMLSQLDLEVSRVLGSRK